ncbi:hypothetical protein K435DRAFT_76 [Dendrothele bispora CBS 962.96]|uniref:Uncharacterized protein n=1 Tax=Dendrothele bispora (strain CBS 962.96) TaxID=1314807 RepID=A0A4S8MY57_DENBC|nr:hypothetical protein K435DRAFT_76 [Dendrothele bispora CBS 962.96]
MPHSYALLLRTSTLSGLKSSFSLPSNILLRYGRISFSFPLLVHNLFLLFHSESLGSLRSSLTLHFCFPCRVGSTIIYCPLAGSTIATGYLSVRLCVAIYFFPSLPRSCAHYMRCFLPLYPV